MKDGRRLRKSQVLLYKMKKKFSVEWNSSKQPRKQRKYRANAPLHIKHTFMSANLAKLLRKKYNKRSFELKEGDMVKVMRGKFKTKTGKISIVNLKKLKVTIEGIQTQKKDGTKINVFFHPSNLQITELNLGDKEREKALNRNLMKKGKIEVEKVKKEKIENSGGKNALKEK